MSKAVSMKDSPHGGTKVVPLKKSSTFMLRGPGNSTSPNKFKELEKTFQTEQTPMGKNLNNAIN